MPDLNHLLTGGGLAPSVLAASLLAGVVRGYTGFGAAMVFMPIASASLGPAAAIAVLWLVDTLMQLPMVARARKLAGYREIRLLLPGALAGAPVGALILAWSDDDFLGALPSLRLAFSFFPPREKQHLARQLLQATGDTQAPLETMGIDVAGAAEALLIETRLWQTLERYGVRPFAKEDA